MVSLPADGVGLQKIGQLLWRKKPVLIGGVVTGMMASSLYLHYLSTPVYSATTTTILESQQPTVIGISSLIGGLTGDTATLNTEAEVLQSRTLLQQVIAIMNLQEDPEFNLTQPEVTSHLQQWKSDIFSFLSPTELDTTEEELEKIGLDGVIDNVRDSITVQNIPKTLVFAITATTSDPRKSARLADTVAQVYISNQLAQKTASLERSADWLAARSETLYQDLYEAETKLNEFKVNTELVSPEQFAGTEIQLKETRTRIAELQQKLQDQKSNPNGSQGDGQIAETRNLQGDISRIQAQLDALIVLEDQLTQMIQRQSAEQIKLGELSRKAEALRGLNEYFLQRMGETTSMAGMQAADSRVLSYATVRLIPTRPVPLVVLFLGGLVGMVAAVLLILWADARTLTFRTADSLEGMTGKPVMGQIPLVPAKARADVIGYLAKKPTSAAAEAIRNLRTSVLLTDVTHKPQIIGTTSSLPGEGKTTTALALALNFSGLGQKVLLIEGDIRRRIFGEYMATSESRGLSAVMAGRYTLAEAVTRDDKVGADILTADVTSTNAADLFSSEAFAKLLTNARSFYDTIIIDTAPVLLVPDSRIIAQHVDAMLFVVAWDSTSHEQVEAALRMFESIDTEITGLVLNQINPAGMKRYGYAGRYGAYASYGKKGSQYYGN